jgi:integrase/recombinase XerD
MLVLMARLGLRASEVVELTLDDIDWTEGTIRIRGPAQRVDRLPLPADVGTALVGYLRHGRPACSIRNVFIRSRAPVRALLGPSAISCMVRRALQRARIDSPYQGSAPVASFAGYADARRGRLARRDRRDPASSRLADHDDLREGRSCVVACIGPSLAGRCAMKPLTKAIHDYLALRRSLGFKLHDAGRALAKFASFMEQQNADCITTQLALHWAQQPSDAQPAHWAQRLSYVRCFARHHVANDPNTEVPPPGLLPFRAARARSLPLFDRRDRAPARTGAAAATIFADLRPMDLPRAAGTAERSRFALGRSAAPAARRCRSRRRRAHACAGPSSASPGWYRSTPPPAGCAGRATGMRRANRLRGREATALLRHPHRPSDSTLATCAARSTACRARLDCAARADSHGPRLHDFRHRFAVETLTGWYRSQQDVERRLPTLSTYLGHVHVADTYWYLSAQPQLMTLAMARMERRWEVRP